MLLVYKPVSLTPLQLIHQVRVHYPEYQNVKLGYAGRLDPMADGLLLILVGEENKNRKQYENLPKEYEFDVLFGVETDTYDILGKIIHNTDIEEDLLEKAKKILPQYIGQHEQPYPPYSSQPVNGKPLYYWARKNKINDITIPTKKIEIYALEFLSQKRISIEDIALYVTQRISRVQGDFRQKEILQEWKDFLAKRTQQTLPILKLRMHCSSGTYIRSFCHTLGKQLRVSAIAFGITRTKIGEYSLEDATYLD